MVAFAVVLVAAALVPQLTARVLGELLLRHDAGDLERLARERHPFRQAAMMVGFVQLEAAWTAAEASLPNSSPALQFAGSLVAFVVAFLSGGVARRIEEPAATRSTALSVLLLRARLVPVLIAPAFAGLAASALPMVERTSAGTPHVRVAMVFVAVLACAVGVLYAGLVLGVLTGALRPARDDVRAIARDAARRERTSLWFVLRLPTGGARLANAAAFPWGRAMVVTDAIVELLAPDELLAVLAHEAGHLSESLAVLAARALAATAVLFAATCVPVLATALGVDATWRTVAVVLFAVIALASVRPLARRMESRADAHAVASVGPDPLARALVKLHRHALAPLTTGAKRVHPDLYDRLTALGHDPGPRPDPPPRRLGLATGVLVGAPIAAGVFWLVRLLSHRA